MQQLKWTGQNGAFSGSKIKEPRGRWQINWRKIVQIFTLHPAETLSYILLLHSVLLSVRKHYTAVCLLASFHFVMFKGQGQGKEGLHALHRARRWSGHAQNSGIQLILNSASTSQAFYSPWEETSHLHPTVPTETLGEHSPRLLAVWLIRSH